MTRARDLADYISTGVSDTELDVLDGVTAGTVTASKALVVDANKDIATIRNITSSGTVTAPTVNASTALQIGGVAVTATATELNIIDGVTATTAELNHSSGVTSGIQTQLNAKATTGKSIAMAMVFG